MPSHHQAMPLRQALIRSCAEEGGPRAVAFNPDALAYEAFKLGTGNSNRTLLLEPLKATSLTHALAETTGRWSWDRGDRIGLREIGAEHDRLYIYAVRRKSVGSAVWRDFTRITEHARWLEHIAAIDLNVVAGIAVGLVGSEHELHARRQSERPEGARR
jgi:hypothetical protein